MRKMKQLKFSALIAIIFASMMFTACGDDDDNDNDVESVYIGDYTIDNAIVSQSPSIEFIYNATGDTMSMPFIGQDFTDMIRGALLNVIPDCTPEESLIELRKDFTMYLSCGTTDWELNAGTWEEKDNGTTLVMNFNQNAIPSAPEGYQLTATNVKLENDTMYSTAVIPIPKDMLAAAMAASGQAELTDNNPDPIMFTLDMKFYKVK